MAGRRAAGPVNTATFEGRLRAARLASPHTAQQLAEALGLASAQSLYDYETPAKPGSPNPEQLGILATKTGRSLEWLVYGEDAGGESEFIATMRGLEGDLSIRRQRELKRTAQMMVEEDRQAADQESRLRELFEMAARLGPQHLERMRELSQQLSRSPSAAGAETEPEASAQRLPQANPRRAAAG